MVPGPYRLRRPAMDEKIHPEERPDNLFEPVGGDHGAHGIFDGQAHTRSPQLWAAKNRGWLVLAGVGVAAAVFTALKK